MTETADAPAPFTASVMRVEPQWIDYNGHLNMAYYNVLFDRAIDQLFAELGVGPNYLAERRHSTMTAECHVRYMREIGETDPVEVHIWLLGADEKRLHTFEQLRHADEGWISATSENMTLHIDMAVRRVAPFPPDIMARVQAMVEAHRQAPRPEGLGRSIAMPRR
jgi:acyl-CoA thioester hydrolase